MKKSTYFYYLIKSLFEPKLRNRMYPVSEEFDKELLYLLENHKFVRIDNYRASLGGQVFWVANHPSCSFCIFQTHKKELPKGSTVLYAYDRLLEDTMGYIPNDPTGIYNYASINTQTKWKG